MPAQTPQHRRRPYTKSGVYTLKRAVQTLGSRALPTKRTALGRALHEWRPRAPVRRQRNVDHI